LDAENGKMKAKIVKPAPVLNQNNN